MVIAREQITLDISDKYWVPVVEIPGPVQFQTPCSFPSLHDGSVVAYRQIISGRTKYKDRQLAMHTWQATAALLGKAVQSVGGYPW